MADQQLNFFSGSPDDKPSDRLFFAIFPNASAKNSLAEIASEIRLKLSLQGPALQTERFHVTLAHLDDYFGLPLGVVRTASEAAAEIKLPSFRVTFDRVGSFGAKSISPRETRQHPLVLRGSDESLAALTEFQQKLAQALVMRGIKLRLGKTNFTPHITLLYDQQVVPETQISPITWTVNEYFLIHSLLRKTRYIELRRWNLEASPSIGRTA